MKLHEITEGLKQEPGETDDAFLDRRAKAFVKNGPSKPAIRVGDPTAKSKEQSRKEYSENITKMNPR